MRATTFCWLIATSLAAAGCSAPLDGESTEGSAESGLGFGDAPGGVPGAWCRPIPACDAPPPPPGPRARWNHFGSGLTAAFGAPQHRGRDLLLNPGDPQWVIAKFAYGLFDKDIKGEAVDVYVLRDCGDTWEYLGAATTTNDDEHATVEGVDDSGGRVYFRVPRARELGVGRHRVHLVVRGDLTSTDLFIEVVPPGTPLIVTDVDGTLTTSETEEFTSLFAGALPGANADAAEAMQRLVAKGYHPLYLTARPEWLVQRTREFLDRRGFPQGIVHTTLGLTGALGADASRYKTRELDALADKDLTPAWAFGNTATDADAYENAGISPLDHRVFYRFDDAAHGSRTIQSYTALLDELDALPSLCE